MLSEQEERALRSLPEFQKELKKVQKADIKAKQKAERERAARRNPDGTWKHKDPHANPYTESGLYGKAAMAEDGDWYGSH